MNKPRRVFQLRKTMGNSAMKSAAEEGQRETTPVDQKGGELQESHVQENEQSIPQNMHHSRTSFNNSQIIPKQSMVSKRNANESSTVKIVEKQLLPHPQLYIDQLFLNFEERINNVQVKNVKIVNIGCSSIQFHWKSKNNSAMNVTNSRGLSSTSTSAIKDPKPKFNQYYQNNVILPGEEQIFSFSFFSEIPGIFVEEFQLICKPQPYTLIPTLKMKGMAFIEDRWKESRKKFMEDLKQKSKNVFAEEIVKDVIENVKSPQAPPPDVTNPQIAQKQFELQNSSQKLYYNAQVHNWFTELFKQICAEIKKQNEEQWDQSVQTLSKMICQVEDPILQESFKKRLENYVFMSLPSTPNKSQLFPMIKQMFSSLAFKVGGDLSDEAKKSMDMWEIPFQQPSEESTQESIKAKLDEKNKITAEWAKKMKKKKWGEQQQKQVMKQYRDKLQKGTSQTLLQMFSSSFDTQAAFEKVNNKLQVKSEKQIKKYFNFLERMKTVKEYPLDGKKIFLKFQLKLKENCKDQLQELEEYLKKKKQEQIRLEEEKKNQDLNPKKKKPVASKKKKGQKEEEEQKPLFFDFNSILDKQVWDGVVQTLKLLLQKQPFLLIIGCNYGPTTGSKNEKYSIKFLLEHLKTIEPGIEFLTHQQLFELPQKIADETLNEGSIYLTENLNFLPCEVQQKQTITIIEEEVQGEMVKKQKVANEKLLMTEVRKELDQITPSIDVIVREDRFNNTSVGSGLVSYGGIDSILGLLWWKYLGIGIRSQNSTILLSGSLTPAKILLISRILSFASKLFLVGEIGLKFWMHKNNKNKFCDHSLSQIESKSFVKLFQKLKEAEVDEKLILPIDFVLEKKIVKSQDEQGTKQYETSQFTYTNCQQQIEEQNCTVVDIGKETVNSINCIQTGHFLILGKPSIRNYISDSLICLARNLYQKQQSKKARHQQERSTPSGINFEKDIIIYMVGIEEEEIEGIELVEKKKKSKKINEDGQEEEEEEEQEEVAEDENQTKKIQLISDFRLQELSCLSKILDAEFNYGLKGIFRYPQSD